MVVAVAVAAVSSMIYDDVFRSIDVSVFNGVFGFLVLGYLLMSHK